MNQCSLNMPPSLGRGRHWNIASNHQVRVFLRQQLLHRIAFWPERSPRLASQGIVFLGDRWQPKDVPQLGFNFENPPSDVVHMLGSHGEAASSHPAPVGLSATEANQSHWFWRNVFERTSEGSDRIIEQEQVRSAPGQWAANTDREDGAFRPSIPHSTAECIVLMYRS